MDAEKPNPNIDIYVHLGHCKTPTLFGQPAVVIDISDCGHGFSSNIKDAIFIPFFSTRETHIGMGLAWAQKIIESHKAEMHFRSTVDEGTTVTIRIPIWNQKQDD